MTPETFPPRFLSVLLLLLALVAPVRAESPGDPYAPCGHTVFRIGRPDATCFEFRKWFKWEDHVDAKEPIHRFVVGKSPTRDWPIMHLSTRDMHNAGHTFTFEIEFPAERNYEETLYLIVGATFYHATEPSLIQVEVNGQQAEPVRQPSGGIEPIRFNFDAQREVGFFRPTVIELPKGCVKEGTNRMRITLRDGSWIFYDYLVLCDTPAPPEQLPPRDLKTEFRAGPMNDVDEILFVVRKPGSDEHWYANFGYYAGDHNHFPFPLGAGSQLNILNVDSGEVRTIFEDKGGTIRDPQLHYDGEKILFSYLPEGKRHFNLYEINVDGSDLRQITHGDWDDIEPTYTASGEILFCSSRSKRWVQCWLTPVATLHRCDADGGNLLEVSANIEHDNTPWPLPNGQILYTRWEYVDRSQVHYHHLWTTNPDGTRHAVYYGNLTPDTVMIDAKPIENSGKIVASFSPGHGRTEHYGWITVVDPRLGPDHPDGMRRISLHADHADPWAFSETAFMATRHKRLELVDGEGVEQILYELPEELKAAGFEVHEPRPVKRREREAIVPGQIDLAQTHGRLALVDVYEGRKMQGVPRGSIKELLVMETLPEPIHYSGGMDQISNGGTFTLARVFGTVPVEPDGSAYMELPAYRSFFFIAMDHEDRPVKRMHSFTNVMPGELNSCIGCHEERTQAPMAIDKPAVKVFGRRPVRPRPVEGIPEVFDFPRDIQPILDRHCLECHNDDRAEDGVILSGDWGPLFPMSYMQLSGRNLLGDNRNRPQSNFSPYEIGSGASRLMKLINENHGDAKLSDEEKKIIRYWLEAGANYAGTYAANGTGLIGWHYRNRLVRNDVDWPEIKEMAAAMQRRCDSCHSEEKNMRLPHSLSEEGVRFNRHWMFNLSRPEQSRLLRSTLPRELGGWQRCKDFHFENTDDPDYKALLAGIERGRRYILEESNRFMMKPFHANEAYTREMIRYGILPPDHDRTKTPIDPYETDQKYWESLWYRPPGN